MLRYLFIIGSLLPLMTGCLGRTPPNVRVSLDQMQAELMAVEDRYYELEYKYKQAQQELAACRGKNGEDCAPESSGEYYDIEMGAEGDPAIIDSSPGVEFFPESYEVIEEPNIDMGNPARPPRNQQTPQIEIPDELQFESGDLEGSSLDGEFELPLGDQASAADWADGITHILLVPQRTGGLDRDGDLSDDGLIVTLLPQDADGRAVIKPAPVMVSVIDPAEVGQDQRVGLWEFSGNEIASLISATNKSASGISLNLPWQGRAPRHNKLMVYVRYINEGNQHLEASMDVSINIPGKIARRPRPQTNEGGDLANPMRVASVQSRSDHLVAPVSVFVEPKADAKGNFETRTADIEELEWQPRR